MDAAPSSGRTDASDAANVQFKILRWHLAAAPAYAEHGTARSETVCCSVYARVTCSACRPLGPRFTMKDTRAPSSRVRYPLASMAEKCTNTSSPLSRWINPKPFPALNHFTVPVSFTFSPCCYFVIGIEARMALKWTATRRFPLIAPHPPMIVVRLMCLLHYRGTLLEVFCAQGAWPTFPGAFQHGRLPFDVS